MAKESEVRLSNSITLNEGVQLMYATGKDVSFIFQGEPGIGKSAMLGMLAEKLGGSHIPVYLDLPLFDIGDTSGVPHTELVKTASGEVKITRFAPNALMGVHFTKPVILMLDEFGKSMRPVQNTMLRTLLERKVGEYSLPEGSIVFGTTNLATDGVGDSVQAHARNRVSFITVRKPDADSWIEWAVGNNVAPEVIAWVKEYPQALASYTDGRAEAENPYIYHPNKTQAAFVTPRSLEKAGNIISARAQLSPNALIAGLAGAVGEAAARDLANYAEMADKLPTWEEIVKNPSKAKIPDERNAASLFITVFGAVTRVDARTLDAWLEYCERLPKEYQGVFAINAAQHKAKRPIIMGNRRFTKWATANTWLF